MIHYLFFGCKMASVRYYLPLVPRPRFIVTTDMIYKINQIKIDSTQSNLIKQQNKLLDDLNVGDEGIMYSKHLIPGTIVRSIVYGMCLISLQTPTIIGVFIIYAYLAGSIDVINKSSNIDKRFKAFMNE